MRLWKPILFSTPMVPAILDGRKTQTRRCRGLEVVNEEPAAWSLHAANDINGQFLFTHEDGERLLIAETPWPVGTRLWVRETTALIYNGGGMYCADGATIPGWTWRYSRDVCPTIHMPRDCARIGLEVTAVRCERVQDITEADAVAEGFPPAGESYCLPILGHAEAHGLAVGPSSVGHLCSTAGYGSPTAVTLFAGTWDLLNAKRGYGWEVNPWVFAYTFTVLSTDYAKTQRRIAEEAK